MTATRSMALGAFLALALVPITLLADPIKGTTAGSTVSMGAIAAHPNTRDDTDTSTTFNVSYFSYCSWIVNGAKAYPGYNFVFAQGGSNIGNMFQNIDPSDFTISQYTPWVVNSNNNTNFISGPDKSGTPPVNVKHSRGVTGQDSGGANIVVTYTPKRGDPTNINFVQAYIESTNGGAFSAGTIDSNSATNPYYNIGYTSGTGTTNRTGTSPLNAAPNPAWILDIPYECENGPAGVSNPNCTGGRDDTLTSEVLKFQTFIEADQTVNGKTYQILYGGVQWGFNLTMVDSPEPSSILLFGSPVLLAGLRKLLRRRT